MPIYPHKCATCGTDREEYRPMADAEKYPLCCGAPMARIYTVPMVRPDIAPFRSPVDGTWIDGRAQREEYMKRNNLRDAGDQRLPDKPREIRPTIATEHVIEAVTKVEQGYKPAPTDLTIDTLSEPT